MKRYKKKRIARRKRRVSEKKILRLKRKLMKRARKLRLGAKRTGAYVYGTLRRIVGNGMKTHNEQGQKLYVVLVKGVPLKYQPPFRPGIIYYTKGWAIKKARVFGGEVMSVANYIKYQRDTRREAIRRGYMPKEYLSEAERRLVGNPGGLKILGYRSGMQYLTDGKDVYRRDKMDMKHGGMRWYSTYASFPASIRAYGPLTSPRGLRGNPLSYHVGGLSSLGAKRESQRRMRTYNQIKKSIQRGNASYGELAVLQSLAKEHPKLFAGDPMMAEAGGISEAQFRRLRGNQGMIRPDPWIRLKVLTPAEALREFHPTRKSISDESEPLLFFRTPTAESPKTIASLARKIGHYNDFNGRKVATVIERIGRIYPKVSIVLGREYSPALWLDNVYEDFAPGFMANAKKFLKTSEESYDPLRRRIRLWWD